MLSPLIAVTVLLAAAPGADPLRWEVPGLVTQVEVPGRMNMAGIPIRLQAYTSRHSVQQLLQHFATAFDEAGFYIERNQRQFAAQPHLTALDTKTFTAYTVILEREPSGLTSVVIGEAKLGAAAPPARPSSTLLYPGAQSPVQGDFEGARTLAYQVVASKEQVADWYREQLTRAGFQEEAPGIFRRSEQELRLNLTQSGGSVQVGVFLTTAGAAAP
ncbi:hypothetical protein [Hyalangium gracile]|uniref:hypothetical protein n=1 Tax=Hyalangium gracile TaxID=394092 RepID=UPI001CCC5F51|nr:hypothetical protein [Hyalangium gracile]